MHAPLSFFELTPTGRLVASITFLNPKKFMFVYRILNLFSRDTYVVDQILPRVIESLCRTFAVSLSIIVVIGSGFPPFLIIVLPLGWLYLRIMRFVDITLGNA
jgi:ATP-binding cassette subfamily C (CFTR/MRP) protein 1